ncbi:hypothetical protein TUSST3_47380 [Streptomyces sp. TUS-ST3]|nr:hypothetical protein TUSST3_47380 [Streptomyces sp. TUS-ST3]
MKGEGLAGVEGRAPAGCAGGPRRPGAGTELWRGPGTDPLAWRRWWHPLAAVRFALVESGATPASPSARYRVALRRVEGWDHDGGRGEDMTVRRDRPLPGCGSRGPAGFAARS